MKQLGLRFAALFLGILLRIQSAPAQQVASPFPAAANWIISIHSLVPASGANAVTAQAREFLEKQFFPQFQEWPGMNVALVHRERGTARSEWALVYTFDTKETRDHYFPAPGVFSAEITTVMAKNPGILDSLFTFFDAATYRHPQDFLVVGSSKTDGRFDVLSIHDFDLTPQAGAPAAEQFIAAEYLLIFRELPGVNAHFAKLDRGEAPSHYAVLFTIESAQTRDLYFPKPEVPSPFVQTLLDRHRSTFQKFDTFFGRERSSAAQYADYRVLARAK